MWVMAGLSFAPLLVVKAITRVALAMLARSVLFVGITATLPVVAVMFRFWPAEGRP